MAHQSPIRKDHSARESQIPDKLYFRIGEVARLCEVPAYVLRFWETEFPQFKPNKGGTGQRLFRRRDVEMALRIKTLLYDEGYTIPGARQLLKSEQKKPDNQLPLISGAASDPRSERIRALRQQMRDLLQILSDPAGSQPVAMPHPLRRQRSAPTNIRRSDYLFNFPD